MLVLVAAGGGILHAKGQISLSAAVIAPGLMVMAIILFMGAVSGAHLNPAVSIAFALRGDTVLLQTERSTLDLDRSEVQDLIARVTQYADDLDDALVERFGGELGGELEI